MKKKLFGLVFLMASVLAVAACGGDDEPSHINLVLPQSAALGTGGYYSIAVGEGYFAEEGLEVDIITTSGGAENVQVIISGDAEIVINTGFASVIGPYKSGFPIRAISNGDMGSPGTFWVVKADSDIQDWSTDLSGKKVAFSRPGSGTNATVLDMVKDYENRGLAPPIPTATGGTADTLAATLTGQIDVGWGFYPGTVVEVLKGTVRPIFSPPDLPGWDNLIVRVIAANADWLEENPEPAKGFLRAWKKAGDFATNDPKAAHAYLAEFTGGSAPGDDVISQFHTYNPVAQRAMVGPAGTNMAKVYEQAIAGGFISEPLTQAEEAEMFPLDFLP